MPVTIKCPDCGHAEQSADGASKTCPECEGTMTAPAKKKYQAKSTSLEDEERTKKRRDEEGEDEKPKKKVKPRKKGGAAVRDGAAAESLDIDTGFNDPDLMALVEEELAADEVLHWAGRMCPEIARRKGTMIRVFGFIFCAFALFFIVVFAAVLPMQMKLVALFPVLFLVIGLVVALYLPKVVTRQAAGTWYAVTNERAIVFTPGMLGSSGGATTYEPKELRRMRVKEARSPRGAGDLIFKTTIQTVVHSSSKGTRTSEQEVHHGFLGIEDVREVETLVHKILLGGDDD